MSGDEPKSAVELAMERLRKKDEEAGARETPATEEQKSAIAEIRRTYQAKLAECEIVHASHLARTFDPEARQALEDQYRRERERLVGERERKIDQVRTGGA